MTTPEAPTPTPQPEPRPEPQPEEAPTGNDSLIEFLLVVQNAIPYRSEEEEIAGLELLRQVGEDMGSPGVVPPPSGAMNPPPETPDVDPGPVAEPVPPNEQPPVPTSPEVAGAAPEESNAFSSAE